MGSPILTESESPVKRDSAGSTAGEPWVLIGGTTGAGGLQVHTAELARALAAAGHPVTIAYTSIDHFSPLLGGSGVRVVPIDAPLRGGTIGLYRRWSAALRPLAGPVAVLCRGQAGAGPLAILAALRRRFGRLYSIEHAMPSAVEGPNLARRRIARRLSPLLIQRAFAVSEAVRQALIRNTGFPPGRAMCCPNWVDTDHFRPDRAEREALRREHGIPPNMLLVGYVGRLAPEKRVDLVIRAFAELLQDAARPTRLVLVGRGWKEQEIHALPRKLGLENDVLFPGWCADVAPWYRAIDVFVLASVLEGFPLVVLEALACGTPCIVHDSAGAREWVDHGRNGFVDDLVGPEDLARSLRAFAALDPTAIERLKQEARRTAVENHDRRRRLGDLLLALGASRAAERLRGEGLPGKKRSYVLTDPG